MNSISRGMFEHAIWDLEEHFNVNYDGMTNRECIDELRKLCPQLHSEEELKEFSKNLLDKIEEEYGFLGLRVWYSLNMKSSWVSNDMMGMKYDKLNNEIKEFVNDYREEQGITLKLDVYIAVIELKHLYIEKFGVLKEDDCLLDTFSILRTIHLTNYSEEVIESLSYLLGLRLRWAGDKYYCDKDLNDVDVLKEIYLHVGEEMGQGDVYRGHWWAYRYDGYGGVVSDI